MGYVVVYQGETVYENWKSIHMYMNVFLKNIYFIRKSTVVEKTRVLPSKSSTNSILWLILNAKNIENIKKAPKNNKRQWYITIYQEKVPF